MRMTRWVGVALALLWAAHATHAAAQEVCGEDVKLQVAKVLSQYQDPTSPEALEAQQALYKEFAYCLQDADPNGKAALRLRDRACGKVPFVGSLYWEQMPCCGYDPQATRFACPIEILQHTGYGAAQFPGSYEHVLVCVDYGSGLVPVARDSVHLADDISGTNPIWNFAALPEVSDEKFLSLHFDSKAYRARAILSWSIAPASCKEPPIWGHAVDFKIRLDP
jgi:hypothetical protein